MGVGSFFNRMNHIILIVNLEEAAKFKIRFDRLKSY